jgi:DNA recombination protein RmuC
MSLESNETSEKILQDIDNYVNLINVKLTEYKTKLETNYKMDLIKVNEKMEILKKQKDFYKNQVSNLTNDKKSLIKIRNDLVKQLETYKQQLDDAKNKRKKKIKKNNSIIKNY